MRSADLHCKSCNPLCMYINGAESEEAMSGMRVVCKLICCSPGFIAAAHCSTLKDLELWAGYIMPMLALYSHTFRAFKQCQAAERANSIPSAAAVFLCRLIAGINRWHGPFAVTLQWYKPRRHI